MTEQTIEQLLAGAREQGRSHARARIAELETQRDRFGDAIRAFLAAWDDDESGDNLDAEVHAGVDQLRAALEGK